MDMSVVPVCPFQLGVAGIHTQLCSQIIIILPQNSRSVYIVYVTMSVLIVQIQHIYEHRLLISDEIIDTQCLFIY